MFDKLRQIEERHRELTRLPSDLSETVEKFEEYKRVLARISEARHILAEDTDREMREMAQAEIDELTARQTKLEEELRALLIPRDPNDDRNVFVEIRAGAGGDEAGLFAAE